MNVKKLLSELKTNIQLFLTLQASRSMRKQMNELLAC